MYLYRYKWEEQNIINTSQNILQFKTTIQIKHLSKQNKTKPYNFHEGRIYSRPGVPNELEIEFFRHYICIYRTFICQLSNLPTCNNSILVPHLSNFLVLNLCVVIFSCLVSYLTQSSFIISLGFLISPHAVLKTKSFIILVLEWSTNP